MQIWQIYIDIFFSLRKKKERGKVYFMLFVKFYIKLAQIKTGDNKILHKF